MKEATILIARFQPVTLGHVRLFDEAQKIEGKLFVGVMEPSKTAGDKSPFFSDSQVLMLDEVMPWTASVVSLKTGFLPDFIEKVRDQGFEPKTLICGSDRKSTYQTQINNYNLDLKIVEVERSDEDVSATEVRKALMEDDEEKFKSLMPEKLHSMYKKLRKELNEYRPNKHDASLKSIQDTVRDNGEGRR